jgi:multimeric flavodoxin WrbA
MKVLGLSCGRRQSNTEIMVKAALMGAEEAGAEVELIRLQDLNLKPCTGCNSCVEDLFERCGAGHCILKNDDFPFIDEKIMQCDGLILGSPIYEKSAPGQLKTLNDRMGPSHDVGFRLITKQRRAEMGITEGEGPDERSFKPRAGSLIAIGGSEWDTLILPMMHIVMLSLQVEVVDKFLVNWIGLPKVIALRDDLLTRAHGSGRHVVESLQKGVDKAEYIGDPGLCPVCHSKLFEIRHEGDVYPTICAICGVRGTMSTAGGKAAFTVTPEDWPLAHTLLSGKFHHAEELGTISLRPPANMDELPMKVAKFKDYLTPSKPPRSVKD